jgi:hypothetical protein
MRGSPYADRVVALVDQQVGDAETRLASLGDRLYVLPATSLETYLPAELFERASRNKADDLHELTRLGSVGYKELSDFKRQLSEQIAAVISKTDLSSLEAFEAAAGRALAL